MEHYGESSTQCGDTLKDGTHAYATEIIETFGEAVELERFNARCSRMAICKHHHLILVDKSSNIIPR